jgi:molecular chaperone GrpE
MNKKNEKNIDEELVEQTDIKDPLAELESKNLEYLAGWQRAKADYINLKKETDELIGNLRHSVKTELFIEFLSLWQHLLTAIEHIPENDKQTDWAQGFMHSRSQVENWLKDNGILRMKTLGQKFDYQKYDAVDTVWDASKPPDIIVAERAPGYERNGKVIIHPKVVVNTPPVKPVEDLE